MRRANDYKFIHTHTLALFFFLLIISLPLSLYVYIYICILTERDEREKYYIYREPLNVYYLGVYYHVNSEGPLSLHSKTTRFLSRPIWGWPTCATGFGDPRNSQVKAPRLFARSKGGIFLVPPKIYSGKYSSSKKSFQNRWHIFQNQGVCLFLKDFRVLLPMEMPRSIFCSNEQFKKTLVV